MHPLQASVGHIANFLTTMINDRGGSRIFSQGGSGGTQTHCHRDATGVSGEGTEGGLGGLPQENFEYEVL